MNPLLDPDARLVIAHRGASADAPENTMAAFRLAVEQGADALELDVRASADGIAVVMHDATLDRTTDRRGPVGARTLAQLCEADAGAGFSPDGGRSFPWRGCGLTIPTLAEVLEAFPEVPLLIEVKEPTVQEGARRAILEAGAAERCVLASFRTECLDAFCEVPFSRGAATPDIARLYVPTLLGLRAGPAGCAAFAVPQRHFGLPIPTRRFVAAARRRGCAVHVWTVDDPAVARGLWGRGVAGLVTNQPREMRAELDRA